MSIIKGQFTDSLCATTKCLQHLHNILLVLYEDITSSYQGRFVKSFMGKVRGEVIAIHCESKEMNADDPFTVALKKAGTGTMGHRQVETEILHCHVVELKLG